MMDTDFLFSPCYIHTSRGCNIKKKSVQKCYRVFFWTPCMCILMGKFLVVFRDSCFSLNSFRLKIKKSNVLEKK